jgi:hypothetical protein
LPCAHFFSIFFFLKPKLINKKLEKQKGDMQQYNYQGYGAGLNGNPSSNAALGSLQPYGSGLFDANGKHARLAPPIVDVRGIMNRGVTHFGSGGVRIPVGTMRNGTVESSRYVPYSRIYKPQLRQSPSTVLADVVRIHKERETHPVAPPHPFSATTLNSKTGQIDPSTSGAGLVRASKATGDAKRNTSTASLSALGRYATKPSTGGVVPTNLFYKNNSPARNPVNNPAQPPGIRTQQQSDDIYDLSVKGLKPDADKTIRGYNRQPARPVYIVSDFKKPNLPTNRPPPEPHGNQQPTSTKALLHGQGMAGMRGGGANSNSTSKYLLPENRERELQNRMLKPKFGNDRVSLNSSVASAVENLTQRSIAQEMKPEGPLHNKVADQPEFIYGEGMKSGGCEGDQLLAKAKREGALNKSGSIKIAWLRKTAAMDGNKKERTFARVAKMLMAQRK